MIIPFAIAIDLASVRSRSTFRHQSSISYDRVSCCDGMPGPRPVHVPLPPFGSPCIHFADVVPSFALFIKYTSCGAVGRALGESFRSPFLASLQYHSFLRFVFSVLARFRGALNSCHVVSKSHVMHFLFFFRLSSSFIAVQASLLHTFMISSAERVWSMVS